MVGLRIFKCAVLFSFFSCSIKTGSQPSSLERQCFVLMVVEDPGSNLGEGMCFFENGELSWNHIVCSNMLQKIVTAER